MYALLCCCCDCYLILNLFAVSPGQPGSISDDPEAVTLTGTSQDAANQINQKEIQWGVG